MIRALRTILLLMVTIICGCAGVATTTVGDGATKEDDAHGFRFYQTAPFLLVHSDGKGGVTGDIVWLPDTTVEMSARPFAVLSNNDTELKFSNGMLSEASQSVDETVVPNAIVSALAKVALTAVSASTDSASPKSPPKVAPPPYLFRIIVKGDSIQLFGRGAPVYPSSNTNFEINATTNGPTQ